MGVATSVFDEIISVLRAQKPCTAEEIAKQIRHLNDLQLELALDFLKEYGLIEYMCEPSHCKRFKLSPHMLNFLQKLETVETENKFRR